MSSEQLAGPTPPAIRQRSWLLILLTVFAGVIAADRVNEFVVRWQYQAFLADFHSNSGLIGDPKADANDARWVKKSEMFRARGLKHPREWRGH